jgi:hypothetical protein
MKRLRTTDKKNNKQETKDEKRENGRKNYTTKEWKTNMEMELSLASESLSLALRIKMHLTWSALFRSLCKFWSICFSLLFASDAWYTQKKSHLGFQATCPIISLILTITGVYSLLVISHPTCDLPFKTFKVLNVKISSISVLHAHCMFLPKLVIFRCL